MMLRSNLALLLIFFLVDSIIKNGISHQHHHQVAASFTLSSLSPAATVRGGARRSSRRTQKNEVVKDTSKKSKRRMKSRSRGVSDPKASRTELSDLRTLIVIDGFTPYLMDICRSYCAARKIRLIEVVSPYLCAVLEQQQEGLSLPASLKAPLPGEEVEWARGKQLLRTDSVKIIAHRDVHVLSVSESGLGTAERLQSALGLPTAYCSGGSSPQLRLKHLSNERASAAGLPVLKECLTDDWGVAKSFLQNELCIPLKRDGGKKRRARRKSNRCVLKPTRGVASDGVFLCRDIKEAQVAFHNLLGQPQFAGGRNDAVLLQEYAEGNEYAVDTVAMAGTIKVVAVWKYKKLPINGAPFVYQCTELVDCPEGSEARAACDYCLAVLEAQGMQYGPTHTEIKLKSRLPTNSNTTSSTGAFDQYQPRLMEINARWHAQEFPTIMHRCLGSPDSVISTLDAYFDSKKFKQLSRYPPTPIANGLIVHLISRKEGKIAAISQVTLEKIRSLSSFESIELGANEGEQLPKTVDIRTDSGYVVLINEDENQLQKDFKSVCKLQHHLFEFEGRDVEAGSDSKDQPVDKPMDSAAAVSVDQGEGTEVSEKATKSMKRRRGSRSRRRVLVNDAPSIHQHGSASFDSEGQAATVIDPSQSERLASTNGSLKESILRKIRRSIIVFSCIYALCAATALSMPMFRKQLL